MSVFNQKKTVIYDSIVAALSFPIATTLSSESIEQGITYCLTNFGLVSLIFAIKLVAFYLVKHTRGMWTFYSTPDFIQTCKAMLINLAASLLTVPLGPSPLVLLIDSLVCLILLSTGRLLYRMYKESRASGPGGMPTLIIGAGEAGDQLVREISRNQNSNIDVLGFLDDDPSVLNRTVHGVRVLGNVAQLATLASHYRVKSVFIAIPSASSARIRAIASQCLELGLEVKTLPTLREIVDGKVHFTSLRPINIEDLLGRDPIVLDNTQLGAMITDRVVLISGGGGSIGSQLCHQIMKFNPCRIVIFEICEFFLYRVENKLREKFGNIDCIGVIGSVRDRDRVFSCLATYRPDLVFHAAAYKHVPMMERNPREAFTTNCEGTRNLVEAAVEYGVEKFILISTDKAVNPTNVMGATKRIAEMICQHFNALSSTQFIVLRFGNVLGSAGSVIPHFLEQIRAGKSVGVTHPEMTRYFMSIPEATQLVLQAGSQGKGGEIFVLDMGEPVPIVDLAEKLIKLSGLKPYEDIGIHFTGLRPGEKLYEELLANDEDTLPTSHKMVRVAKARGISPDLMERLDDFRPNQSDVEMLSAIKNLVPEFSSAEPPPREN